MHLGSSSAAGVRFLGSIKEGHGLKPSAREAGIDEGSVTERSAIAEPSGGARGIRSRSTTGPVRWTDRYRLRERAADSDRARNRSPGGVPVHPSTFERESGIALNQSASRMAWLGSPR